MKKIHCATLSLLLSTAPLLISTPAHADFGLDRLRSIIAEHLGVSVSQISTTSRLKEDLGADSLDIVELISAVQEQAGVSIPDSACDSLRTVNDLLTYASMPCGIDALRNVVAQQLNVEVSRVSSSSRLREDLGADSIDIVELTMAVKEATGVEIPESACASMRTVDDIYRQCSTTTPAPVCPQ